MDSSSTIFHTPILRLFAIVVVAIDVGIFNASITFCALYSVRASKKDVVLNILGNESYYNSKINQTVNILFNH